VFTYLIVAAAGIAIALAGYLTNRTALNDAWAREWTAQRPLVVPRVPANPGGSEMLTFKNVGSGPALKVEGEVVIRAKNGGASTPWSDISAGTIAVDDEETAVFRPRIAPTWALLSGTIHYADLAGGAYITRFNFSASRGGGGLQVTVHPQEVHAEPQPADPERGG
jgi:hypothetical protein